MSSRCEAILSAIKGEVAALASGYTDSKYTYDLTQNNRMTSKKVYAVRPLAANSSTQTNLAWTTDQEVDIALSQVFANKSDSDSALNTTILSILTDVELVGKQLFRKKLLLSYVLGVLNLDVSEPQIDNENNIVTITIRATVRYRMEY